jgi:hypothetical protein
VNIYNTWSAFKPDVPIHLEIQKLAGSCNLFKVKGD